MWESGPVDSAWTAPWSPASESLELSLAGNQTASPSDGRPLSVISISGMSTHPVNFCNKVAGKVSGSVGWSLLFTVAEQQSELGLQLSGVVVTLRYSGPPVIFCLTTEESPLFLELKLPGSLSRCWMMTTAVCAFHLTCQSFSSTTLAVEPRFRASGRDRPSMEVMDSSFITLSVLVISPSIVKICWWLHEKC